VDANENYHTHTRALTVVFYR